MIEIRKYPGGPKTIYYDGIPLTIATETMLRRAKTAVRADEAVYYLRDFIRKFDLAPAEDLSRITIADIRAFADDLIAAGKSRAVCKSFATIISQYFSEYRDRGGLIHESLLIGDAIYYASRGRRAHNGGYRLLVAEVILGRASAKRIMLEPQYSKWLTDDEIIVTCQSLSLRDRCIFQIQLCTGYRISSTLSIALVPRDLQACVVTEQMSKTGVLHQASIGSDLRDQIIQYVNTDRAKAVSKAGFDCGLLFLTSKGAAVGSPLTYNGYYHNLKSAEAKIHKMYPQYETLILHSHAGRSTYLTRLIDANEERKAQGQKYLSDAEIMYCMDWSTPECLKDYYNFRQTGNMTSTLWDDLKDY